MYEEVEILILQSCYISIILPWPVFISNSGNSTVVLPQNVLLSICVANQQIQTEIVKTVEQHVQAGSTGKQQGVCCENKYEEEETINIAALLSFYSDLFSYIM